MSFGEFEFTIVAQGLNNEVHMVEAAGSTVPTVTDVSRIAAIPNRVIRNLEITECYAQLSNAMRMRTGTAANWCTFATWASRQAGGTIRGEDLLSRCEARLRQKARLFAPLHSINRILLRKGMFEPDTPFGRIVSEIHTPFDAFERASAEVAAGNLKVFEEIGREFARFIASVPENARHDSGEVIAFVSALRPGLPPDGQDYLKEAFTHYQQQRYELDPAARAKWILLANLKVGLHEQTRLQPQIAAAIDAPLTTAEDLGARVLHTLIARSDSWSQVIKRPTAGVLGWFAARLRDAGIRITREVVTESMMVLALPNRVLSLGQNLDVPVPAVFNATSDTQLDGFVKEYDPCAPGINDCAAEDWADLHQRMHYIIHLFRAYAEESSLFSRPFTDEQVASFRAGVVPNGIL